MTPNSSPTSPKPEGRGPFHFPAESRLSVLDWRGTWQGTKINCSPSHRAVLSFLHSSFFLLPGLPNKRPLRNHSFRTRQHCSLGLDFSEVWVREREMRELPRPQRSGEELAPGDEQFPKQLAKLESSNRCQEFPSCSPSSEGIFSGALASQNLLPCGSNPNLPSPL